jgi:hypothetical protein
MSNSEFKKAILEKYGTITRFCRLSNLDYDKTCRELSKHEINFGIRLIIQFEFDTTPCQKIAVIEVTDELIDRVREAIKKTGLAPTTWAKSQGIPEMNVSRLLSGKAVLMSKSVMVICDRLNCT